METKEKGINKKEELLPLFCQSVRMSICTGISSPQWGHRMRGPLEIARPTSSGLANSCHMGTSNAVAIFSKADCEGFPANIFTTAILVTPNLSANSCCVNPFFFNNSLILFMFRILSFCKNIYLYNYE